MTPPSFLKSERIWLALMLAMLATTALAVWVSLAVQALEPSPLKWETVSPPIITSTSLTITAETIRHDDGCTSGPQIDVRSGSSVIRLPVPTRVTSGKLSTYQTVLAFPLKPGPHAILVREIIVCDGVRHDIPSPWIAFTVSPSA